VRGPVKVQFGVQAFVVCAFIPFLCFCLAVSGSQEPSDIPNGGDRAASPDVLDTDTTLRVRSDLVLIPVTFKKKSGVRS